MDFGQQPVPPGSDGIFPRFYIKAVQMEARSLSEGRPIFEDKEYVQIVIGGDKNTSVDRKVTDEDRARWPGLYQRFKQGLEQAIDGTPLEQWALLTPSQVQEFKAANIPTVEALAAVSDAHLRNLGPGGRQIRDRAKLYLEQSAGANPLMAMQTELERMREQMEAMQKTIDEQATALQRRTPEAAE